MKILILGPVASGKTTLANKLQKLIDIPMYSIDKIVHDDENKLKRKENVQRKIINDIIRKNKEWIIEGMPRTHLEVLASNATLILYLDVPKKVLRKNLFYRELKIKLGIVKKEYKYNKDLKLKMKEYIEQDNNDNLKTLMKKYPSKIIIMKNKNETKKLFHAIEDGHTLKYQ